MNATAGWAWADDRLRPLADARIPLLDRGYLLGDGVFETLRARGGRLLAWPLHRDRMAHGLAVLGIEASALETAAQAAEAVTGRAARDVPVDLYVRVQVARCGETGREADPGTVTASARPCPVTPERLRQSGARLRVAAWRRDPGDPLAGVKPLSYLPHVLARRAARAAGCDDALVLNTAGRVCESSYGNIVARVNGAWYAPGPDEGALDGVTRRLLLERAVPRGETVHDRLPVDALEQAEEVLLLSTLAGVVPVRAIDGVASALAGGHGRFAARFAAAYEALLDSA